MSAKVSENQILIEADAAGAFASGAFNQEAFVRCVEKKLNVSANGAVDLLVEAGLVSFSYPSDPTIAPRDALDLWRLALTPKGEKVLVASNHSLQGRRP